MSPFRLFKWKSVILLETALNTSRWSRVNVMCCVLHWRQSQFIFTVFFSGKFFVILCRGTWRQVLFKTWSGTMTDAYSEICGLAFCGMWLQHSVYSWWALLGIVFSLWHTDGWWSLWLEEKLVLPVQQYTLHCKYCPGRAVIARYCPGKAVLLIWCSVCPMHLWLSDPSLTLELTGYL